MRFTDLLISFKQVQKRKLRANSMKQSTWKALSRLAGSEISPPFMGAQIYRRIRNISSLDLVLK